METVKNDIAEGKRHALTSDCWQSVATESYMTSICHYINKQYDLESRVLDTTHTPESHTADNLSKELKNVVTKWGLNDIVAVTDNARNVVNACALCGFDHFGCCAHVMNLGVNKALAVPEVKSLIGKCRKLVQAFKQSGLRTSHLKKAEKLLDPKVNC